MHPFDFVKHRIPIAAEFGHCVVLTYAFPRAVLEPLVAPGLSLDCHEGRAFLAVALVQTRDLRPSGLPRRCGRDFFLCGYRIFTRFETPEGRLLRGLQILRSDSDKRSMVWAGNALTRYSYEHARVDFRTNDRSLEVRVRTKDRHADLDLAVAFDGGALPSRSPFESLKVARRFAGPLPNTFSYESRSDSMLVIRGVRSAWRPKPVRVLSVESGFLEDGVLAGSEPLLASAFHLSNISYLWERGVRYSLRSPRSAHRSVRGLRAEGGVCG